MLSRSERFFSTPSATARRLFYYVTRVGHYYYDARYNFLDSCDIAHLKATRISFLTYVRSGTMYFETDQLYCAERGQIGLVTAADRIILYQGRRGSALDSLRRRKCGGIFRADTRVPRRQVAYAAGGFTHRAGAGTDHFRLAYRRHDRAGPLAAHLPNPVRAAVSGAGGTRPEKRCHCTGGQVYRRTPV